MATLTDRAMLAKPGENDKWISDGGVHGQGQLYGRITKAGSRLFYFRYTDQNGKRENLQIGKYDQSGQNGMRLKDARKKAGELSALYVSGIKDIKGHLESENRLQEAQREAEEAAFEARRKADEAKLTVNDLFDRWKKVELIRHKDKGKEASRIINKDVLPVIGSLLLEVLNRGHVAEIIDNILARGKNRLAKITFALMRQMFTFAVERDLMKTNPTDGIRKANIGGKDVERDRVLSEDEIRDLAEKIQYSGLLPSSQAAIWILLSTCARVGELFKAEWEHIDFEKKIWFIPAENAKNGFSIKVNLSEFALKQFRILNSLNNQSKWLFPSPKNKHLHPSNLSNQTTDRQKQETDSILSKRTKKNSSLILSGGHWTPHDLRRTGTTLMVSLGITPEVADRCSNHVEPNRVRRIYQRYSYEKEMKKAWHALGRHIESLTGSGQTAKVIHLDI